MFIYITSAQASFTTSTVESQQLEAVHTSSSQKYSQTTDQPAVSKSTLKIKELTTNIIVKFWCIGCAHVTVASGTWRCVGYNEGHDGGLMVPRCCWEQLNERSSEAWCARSLLWYCNSLFTFHIRAAAAASPVWCANRTLQRPAGPTVVSRQRRDGVGWAAPDPHQFIWLEAFVLRGKKTNKWRREAAGRAFLPAVTLYYSTVTRWSFMCMHSCCCFPCKKTTTKKQRETAVQ